MTARLITWTIFALLWLTQFAAAGKIAFKTEQSYPVGSNPVWVVAGDFNNDGKRDLAVVNQGDPTVGDPGGVSILLGNGDGTFQPAKNIAIGKNCTGAAAGDFDGDGKEDLVLVRPGDATVNDDGDVTIFLGNGDGTFRQGQVLTPGKNPSSKYFSIAAADLNGDQWLDLVVANSGDKTFGVMLGNGNGTFQSAVVYPVASPPDSLFVADLAGNGGKDLVVFGTGVVYVWSGNGDGTFRQGSNFLGGGILTGDFNGDRRVDLVQSPPFHVCLFRPCSPVYPGVKLGNGDGTFQPFMSIGESVTAAGDFDGDGKLDLVGAGDILPGNGDGTFQPQVSLGTSGAWTQVLDVNGDGAPDLVAVGQNVINVLANTGTDFSISATALSPGTVNAGQSASSTLTLKLLSNFKSAVSLSCSVQPTGGGGATCSLSSNSVTFDASGNASTTVTVNAASSTARLENAAYFHTLRGPGVWLPVAGFVLFGSGFGVGLSGRRRLLTFIIGAIVFTGLILQTACGGGSSGPKSTAYVVTVTGSSATMQHSTRVSLTVQ